MKIKAFSVRPTLPAAILLVLLGLAGCGGGKPLATKVAAKVNGTDISAEQLNAALANVQGVTPETADQARREVLDKLIEQQLAVEQAQEKKLDQTPEVLRAIAAARREILARAYRDQLAAALPKATIDEAKSYYSAHPQLFAQRRVYKLQEIVMPAQGVAVDKLREMANGQSMEDIASWLKQQNIPFSGNATTRAAEQLPLDMLPKLSELKDGQSAIFTAPKSVSLVRIVASQSAPIDEASALPQILHFLANQSANTALAANIKQLREKAKIDIVAPTPDTLLPAKP